MRRSLIYWPSETPSSFLNKRSQIIGVEIHNARKVRARKILLQVRVDVFAHGIDQRRGLLVEPHGVHQHPGQIARVGAHILQGMGGASEKAGHFPR